MLTTREIVCSQLADLLFNVEKRSLSNFDEFRSQVAILRDTLKKDAESNKSPQEVKDCLREMLLREVDEYVDNILR